MALAVAADVESALGRNLAETEDVDALLDEASDLVVAYLCHRPDPVPHAVTRVVADMVVAVLTKPTVSAAQYAPDYSGYGVTPQSATVRVGAEAATTTGPWLTRALRMRLRPYKRGGWTIDPTPGS